MTSAQRDAAILGALESVMGVEMEFGKAAAGTFGPTSAAMYAGFVEGVANRDKGAAVALGHAAVGGAAAWVGSPSSSSITQLRTTWTVLRAGGSGAAQNAAEDLGHQLVDSGGDPSKIDLGRTATNATVGAVTGMGTHMTVPSVHTELNPPIIGTRAPAAPAVDAPDVHVHDPGSRGVPTAEMPAVSTPHNAPTVEPHVSSADLPPPTRAWPRDGSGRVFDPGGNHLFTETPTGLHAPDGTPVTRVITDGAGQPIGYETAHGTQTISFARPPDPSVRPTVHDAPAVPDPESPPTTQF
jgi:hypothetical protein